MTRNRIVLAAAAATLLPLCLLSPPGARAQWATSGNNVTSTNAGNVGVGTGADAPTNKLTVSNGTVAGNDAFALFGNVVPNSGQVGLQFGRSGPTSGAGIIQGVKEGVGANNISLQPSGGWVGIGTSSPANTLHISSPSAAFIRVSGSGVGAVNFQDVSAPANSQLYQWRSEGGLFRMALVSEQNSAYVRQNILVATPSGNVGIGTATPAYPLTVRAEANVSPLNLIGGGGGVEIWKDASASKAVSFGPSVPGSPAGDDIQLSTFDGAAWAGRVTIKNTTGNVGVGTTSPAARLDVSGSANVSGALSVGGALTAGSITATYQDVAEWVPSGRGLAAGTVVVLDAGRTNHVVASTTAYDTKVAGVVSARPGVILGEWGEGKALVATTGRVRVKVDARGGPIEVGDLLVTSEAEGAAMRSVPVEVGGVLMHRPGTIIGKALEALASGTGEILVLLSLQ